MRGFDYHLVEMDFSFPISSLKCGKQVTTCLNYPRFLLCADKNRQNIKKTKTYFY